MNKVDIVRKHIGNDDFYDINGTPLLTKILAAMDEYTQHQVKNCSIPAIIGELACDSCSCHPTVIYATSKGRFCERCKPAS